LYTAPEVANVISDTRPGSTGGGGVAGGNMSSLVPLEDFKHHGRHAMRIFSKRPLGPATRT